MNKIIFSLITFLLSFNTLFAQDNRIFGITIGGSNYITDSDVVFTKSQPGFSFGLVEPVPLSKRFELLFEINYTQNYTKFIGRQTKLSEPEDIKFKMGNINIPFIVNYNFSNLKKDFIFGAQAGPSLCLFHNYNLVDSSKEDYFLDPIYLKPKDLAFDTENERTSVNVFFAVGASVTYKENFMCNLRYYKGLTDPYRNAPFYSTIDNVTVSSKESYFALSFVYFIED